MKQNLIQMQLRLSNSKPNSMKIDNMNQEQTEIIDFTSKAFFVANQIMNSDFLFSKRALATFLNGKPIILQQPSNQRPSSSLKGFMSLYEDAMIQRMIDLMIDLNILGQKKVSLKQRSTKRLYTIKKYQFQEFPKVLLRTKSRKSIEISFTKKIVKKQPQKVKQKSRLTSFLVTKTSLPVNIQKKQQQMKIKTQRQREQEQQRKKKQREQIRRKRQQEKKAIDLQKQRQEEIKRKQLQKQAHIQKMNDFWMKQKEKIQSVISPSDLRNYNKEKQKQQSLQNKIIQEKCIQLAGNVLHMQMKQLKQQQQQRKNPIKPYISWSFMKQTFGIDSSQSNRDKKQCNDKNNNNNKKQQKQISIVNLDQDDDDEIMLKQNELLTESPLQQPSVQININYCTFKKEKQQHLIEYKTPYLGLKRYQSPQISSQNQRQKHQLSFVHTESTDDATITNYNLRNLNKKQKKHFQEKQNHDNVKNQDVFAQSPQDSMFSNSYYALKNKGQETITNKKVEKVKKRQIQQHVFTFKRRSTLLANQETFTIAKKLPQKISSQQEEKSQNQKQVQDNLQKKHKKEKDNEKDEIQHTITLAVPNKRLSEKIKMKELMDVVFSDNIPKYEIEMFSQTITTPQPKTRDKKICTSDFYPLKTQQKQRPQKRDSFVEQLINQYYNKRPYNNNAYQHNRYQQQQKQQYY